MKKSFILINLKLKPMKLCNQKNIRNFVEKRYNIKLVAVVCRHSRNIISVLTLGLIMNLKLT